MGKYPVTNIFRSLQGEGFFVGQPMVFVRLAGCGVTDCHIRAECDEAPWPVRDRLSASEIAAAALALSPRGGVALVTGGEPAERDLGPLFNELRGVGFEIHLETSGARAVPWRPDWLTVSPKTPDYVVRDCDALKVVVRPGWGWREVEALAKDTRCLHPYLQPLTGPGGSPLNLAEVAAMVLSSENRRGWALSWQAHRAWSLP